MGVLRMISNIVKQRIYKLIEGVKSDMAEKGYYNGRIWFASRTAFKELIVHNKRTGRTYVVWWDKIRPLAKQEADLLYGYYLEKMR